MISTNVIYLVWLPVALAVILGILGLFRGAVREALVSVSVLLGALVIQTWASLWAGDALDIFPSLDRSQIELTLNIVVLGLIVLVAGYLLGSALISRSDHLSAASRLAGALIGLANGAAIGGWLLRLSYLANTSGGQLDNDVSKYLIIWAGWFPLVVAIVAAIIALVGPVRRARTRVAEPAPQTNWTPAAPAAPPTSAPPNVPYPIATTYGASYPPAGGGSSAPTQPYTPGSNPASPAYAPAPGSVASTMALPIQDSSPTSVLPASKSYAPEAQSQPQQQATAPYVPSTYSSAPAVPPVLGATEQGAAHYSGNDTSVSSGGSGQSTSSGFQQKGEPSWLVKAPAPVENSGSSDTSGIATSQSDAPADNPTDSSAPSANAGEDADTRICPNCGASLPANARFCTDCGTPLS